MYLYQKKWSREYQEKRDRLEFILDKTNISLNTRSVLKKFSGQVLKIYKRDKKILNIEEYLLLGAKEVFHDTKDLQYFKSSVLGDKELKSIFVENIQKSKFNLKTKYGLK